MKTFNKAVLMVSFFSFLFVNVWAQDSTEIYATKYPFLHPEFGMIQFYSRTALDTFNKSWNETKAKKMSIVHLGDSHLQSDLFPGKMRKYLQAELGDGGRGIMFPYSTAKTYSSVEYHTTHTGEWTYGKSLILPPKIPLGVSGMTSKTIDTNASFTFTFINDVPSNYSKLKIFCKKDSISYDLVVEVGGKFIPVNVDTIAGDSLPYYEIDLPSFKNEIIFHVKKNHPNESELVFYGMSLETPSDNGLIYHNCGVGGAMYKSILYENLFAEQIPALHPDLIIIDFGTNDYLYDDSIKANEETIITQVVQMVHAASPNASIILTSTMDMYHKADHVTSGEIFSNLIKKVAKAQNCGVFDWYWVAGGWNVMPKFQEQALANPDGIHMSPRGYRLKANLLSQAMVKTILWMKENPTKDSLVFQMDSLKKLQLSIRLGEDSDSIAPGPRVKVMHKIKKGESLSVIAKKYHVTVAQLRTWNHMQSNLIHTGKYLLVYCDPKFKPKPKPKAKPKPAGTKPTSPKPK
ncbi:MAG: GDSL-type esterase/lipase family protein [Bacteroidetes bacterium]|nr:GDSL-type esterase/lipase family protein [Bacteroidota bacterium]